MLGKTANGLFWMYRYLERAEHTARLIQTGQRIALTRSGAGDVEWRSILKTVGALDDYHATYDEVAQDKVIDWLLCDRSNPSSVLSSLAAARQNARSVRTALTHDTWEATNGAYMWAREALAGKLGERDLPKVLHRVRERSALVRGATDGTMLRNDIFDFLRLGTFLERADNTARILDVKYYVLLPSVAAVGGAIDNAQWEMILRSVSGSGGFRMEYGSTTTPRDIAKYLILDRRMPRSLAFCVQKLRSNLGDLAAHYGTPTQAHKKAIELERVHLSGEIDAIFDYGLHEFIQTVLSGLGDLGRLIETDYRFYE